MGLGKYYNLGIAQRSDLFDPALQYYRDTVHGADLGLGIANRAYRVGASGIAGTAIFSDVPEESDRLNVEIDSFTKEMTGQIFHADGSRDQVLNDWYAAYWVPFLAGWNTWRDKHSHWYRNMFMSAWHEVQEYRARFIALHDAAKVVGFKTTVDPTPVRKDAFRGVYDDVGNKITSVGDQIWSMIKIIVYAGAIIVMVVLVKRYL